MPAFSGYPDEREGPSTSYAPKPGTNPVVRGFPLAIAGSAAANLSLVSGFLWSNAGFNSLRKLEDLNDYEPRYDPTVVPLARDDNTNFGVEEVNGLVASLSSHEVLGNTAIDFHAAFTSGKATPSGVAETLLQLISTSPEHAKAFLDINKSIILAAAEESNKRYKAGRPFGVLDGVPVGVKDEVDLAGHQKSLGTCKSEPCPKSGTSWCVKKLEEAGAIVIGKLNMHELGLDTTNNNPTGRTPLNPYNPCYYTGGSSGGSAYAVSAGLLPLTLGADGGGSIRIPSAYCGIYGLKPSHGRVSGSPTKRLAKSNGVFGPMASSMLDLEIGYRFMAIPDPNNSESYGFAPPIPNGITSNGPRTIGIYKPWFERADPTVLNACHAALSCYESAGYSTIDISIPYLTEGQRAHAFTILSEAASGQQELSHLAPANKILLSVGKQTPAFDFLLAQKMRSLLMEHLAFLFHKHPGLLIVTPTTPNAGWHISGGAADLKYGISDGNMSIHSMEYIWLANFTGCPALSIPVGLTEPKEGTGKIPVGLMAMAEWGAEEALLQWGKIGEQWTLERGNERISKPENWVDVLKLAMRAG